jgi:type I restriction enzyme S subunit
MNNWKETTLDEIAYIIMGQSPSSESYNLDGDGLPFYQGVTEFGDKYLCVKNFTNSPTKVIDAGSILFSVRAPVGRVNFTKNKCCIGRGNAGLMMKNGEQEFLYYLLKYLEKIILKNTTGTVFDSISGVELRKFPVSVPESKNEQKQIASVLSSLDDKIELLRKENETLEKIAQTIFKEWFVNFNFPDENGKPYKNAGGKMIDSELGEIPEGWRVGKLNEVVEFINGYAFKSSDLLGEEIGNCYKVFKMGNIKKGGGFDFSKTKSFVKKNKFKNLDKFILKKGDILMSMTDMKDAISLLGHTALMIYNDKYIVNQRVGLIRPLNDLNIGYPFLYLLTNDDVFIGDLRGRANSGVQVNLSTDAIKNSKLVIADKKTNNNFNELSKPLFDKMRINELQIQILSRLCDTLLPRLMSGRIKILN